MGETCEECDGVGSVAELVEDAVTTQEIERAMRGRLRHPHVVTREAGGEWGAAVRDASTPGGATHAAVAGYATEGEALDALARLCEVGR